MKRVGGLALFFSLFLVLSSFSAFADPEWWVNVSSTPTTYNGTLSTFNITLNDTGTNNSIDKAFIELNWTGTPTNYTMTNAIFGGLIYNYTNLIGANSGNAQYWRVYFNNTTNSWNSTGYWNFTIGKGTLTLALTASNVTYSNTVYVNGTRSSISGDSDVNYTLWRNETTLAASSNSSNISDTALLKPGLYNYTFNATGGANWTANATGLFLANFINVSKGTPNVTLYINGTSSNTTVNLNSIINITAVSNVPGLNVSLTLNNSYGVDFQINATPQTNLTNMLSLGVLNFSAQTLGNENYTNSSLGSLIFFVANITAYPASASNYSPNTAYNFSITLPKSVSNVIFSTNINGTNVNFTGSALNVTNWNKTLQVYNDSTTYYFNVTDLPAASRNYAWLVNDSNSWYNTSSITYAVASPSAAPSFYVDGQPGSWSVVTGATTTLKCVLAQATISISGASCAASGNGTVSCAFTTPSTAGSSLYTCTVTGNYTNVTTQTLSYAPFTSSTNPGSSSGSNTSSGSFLLTPSSSSVEVSQGASNTITLTLKNTRANDITSVNITVSGIDSSWYSLDQTTIARLQHNTGTANVTLTLNVPSSAEQKNYSMIVTASGLESGISMMSIQTTIKLVVPVTNQSISGSNNATTNASSSGSGLFPGLLSGLSLNGFSDYIIILIIVAVAGFAVFMFRGRITGAVGRGGAKPAKAQPAEKAQSVEKAPKKAGVSALTKMKDKIHHLTQHRIVIQVKHKDELKKEEDLNKKS